MSYATSPPSSKLIQPGNLLEVGARSTRDAKHTTDVSKCILKKKFQFTVIKVLFIMTCVLDRQVGDSPKELQKLNRVNPTPNYPVFFIVCISLLENTNYNADRSINLDTRYWNALTTTKQSLLSLLSIDLKDHFFIHSLHSDLNPRPFNYSRNSVNILSIS